MSKTNGQKPKVEVAFGESTRLRLLRNEPITGSSSFGNYWLYPVVTETGTEESFFAPEPVHNVIKEHNLKAGDEFILSRVQNGKPGSTKLEISIIGKTEPEPSTDNLKQLLLASVRDAVDIVKEAGIQFSNDEIQKLATTLFIQRSRLA